MNRAIELLLTFTKEGKRPLTMKAFNNSSVYYEVKSKKLKSILQGPPLQYYVDGTKVYCESEKEWKQCLIDIGKHMVSLGYKVEIN
jgi:hypothetical protein